MPHLQGLIFDLDGTLIDSAPDVRQALNAMLAQQGRRALTLEEVKGMSGDGLLVQMQRALAATGAADDGNEMRHFQQYITAYRSLRADPAQIYPYVRETLENYSAAGVKLGICTNKQESATYRLLEELGLRRFFEFIAGGDTFPVHKPNPDHVYGVIAALDVPRESCVMIGDSQNDITAAHGAGIPCLIVTHGYGADYDALRADGKIGSFQELPEALKQLGFA